LALRQKVDAIASTQKPTPPTNAITSDSALQESNTVTSVETPEIHPIGQRELSKRLGLKSHTYLTTKKLEPGFPEWSRKRDCSGLGWRFDAEAKLFYPVMS